MKIDKQSHGWARAVSSAVVEKGVRGTLRLEIRGGEPVLFKLPGVELTDSKEGKSIGIQTHIGRRPIFLSNSNREPRFSPCRLTEEK